MKHDIILLNKKFEWARSNIIIILTIFNIAVPIVSTYPLNIKEYSTSGIAAKENCIILSQIKNEILNIKKWLEYHTKICEVFIIDDDSDDGTSEILQYYKINNQIQIFQSQGKYMMQENYASLTTRVIEQLPKPSGKLLFILDIDEYLKCSFSYLRSIVNEKTPCLRIPFKWYGNSNKMIGDVRSEKKIISV